MQLISCHLGVRERSLCMRGWFSRRLVQSSIAIFSHLSRAQPTHVMPRVQVRSLALVRTMWVVWLTLSRTAVACGAACAESPVSVTGPSSCTTSQQSCSAISCTPTSERCACKGQTTSSFTGYGSEFLTCHPASGAAAQCNTVVAAITANMVTA